jgi:protein-disulfide isomerase
VLPGVDLEGLSEAQRRSVAEVALTAFCPCGCPHGLSACLREHRDCKHAQGAARLAVRLARLGGSTADVQRYVAAYYASFDRRGAPDPAAYGPPLGNPAAPVTLVEVSDFTCPFCRQLRPKLEAFVQARADRVKLVYVPFPIETHPGALEAAQAAEWAREAGIFWPMHDALFEAVHPLSTDALAELAEELGGDGASLREALESGRLLPRVRSAQAAARAVDVRATPTLFMNGRKLVVPDFSDEALEDALRDEEEWVKHGGWARD